MGALLCVVHIEFDHFISSYYSDPSGFKYISENKKF